MRSKEQGMKMYRSSSKKTLIPPCLALKGIHGIAILTLQFGCGFINRFYGLGMSYSRIDCVRMYRSKKNPGKKELVFRKSSAPPDSRCFARRLDLRRGEELVCSTINHINNNYVKYVQFRSNTNRVVSFGIPFDHDDDDSLISRTDTFSGTIENVRTIRMTPYKTSWRGTVSALRFTVVRRGTDEIHLGGFGRKRTRWKMKDIKKLELYSDGDTLTMILVYPGDLPQQVFGLPGGIITFQEGEIINELKVRKSNQMIHYIRIRTNHGRMIEAGPKHKGGKYTIYGELGMIELLSDETTGFLNGIRCWLRDFSQEDERERVHDLPILSEENGNIKIFIAGMESWRFFKGLLLL